MIFPNLKNEKILGIDIETYDPYLLDRGPGAPRNEGYILGVSIGTEDSGWYFPLNHIDTHNNVDRKKFIMWLKELFDTPRTWIGANIVYDLIWIYSELKIEISKQSKIRDVQTIETLICSPENLKLETLSNKYLNESKDEEWIFNEAIKLGIILESEFDDYKKDLKAGINAKVVPNKVKSSLHLMTGESVKKYAEKDANLPVRIYSKQLPLINEQDVHRVVDLESRLIPVLTHMYIKGVKFDVEKAIRRSDTCKKEINKLNKELFNEVGFEFNPSSPDDLIKVAESRGWKIELTPKSGKIKTSEDYIMSHGDPIGNIIQRISKLEHTNSLFFEGCLNKAGSGRLHTTYYAVPSEFGGTRTGRLSSSNPNLQNIATENDDPILSVRDLFLPDEDSLWGCFDYSQQEYRLLIHFCYALKPFFKNYRIHNIQSVIESINHAQSIYINDPNTDFHDFVRDTVNAALFKSGSSMVLDRKPIKNLNFMSIYGGGKKKTQMMLGVSKELAEEIATTYHSNAPYVKAIQKVTDEESSKRGFIKTISGRKCRFTNYEPREFPKQDENGDYIFWKPYPLDKAVEVYKGKPLKRAGTYRALNYLIQGSGGDIMKQAMVNLYENHGIIPHLTVHDEIDLSLPLDESARYNIINNVLQAMEDELDFPLNVPMKCDIEVGTNWLNIEKIKRSP